jgi:hypothetical protein
MKTDVEYVHQAMQLIREHANEDYNLSRDRNEELTALAVGIAFVADKLGATSPVTKESVVAAYLLGRMDGMNGA